MRRHLRSQLVSILRMPPSELDAQKSFKDLGLDSLTGLELRNRINLLLTISLSATAIWNYPTIAQLAAHITDLLDIKPGEVDKAPPTTASADAIDPASEEELTTLLEELEGLSEDDVRRLLSEDISTGGISDE